MEAGLSATGDRFDAIAIPKIRFVARLENGTYVLWAAQRDRYAAGRSFSFPLASFSGADDSGQRVGGVIVGTPPHTRSPAPIVRRVTTLPRES
ncbi:MAG: hypothetical protein R2762_10070 [Bryobacteraceae bacterium]